MTDAFTNLWSWSFLAGLVAGFVLNRAYCLAKTCWLERHRPLPDGRHRSKWRALSIDRRYVIGLLAIAFLGWSVITTSDNAADNKRNAEQAAAFAERVKNCQSQLIAAINASRQVTAENEKISSDNDRLSREERSLLADGQRALVEWVGNLVNPSDPNVRNLDVNDPVRQQYGIDVSRAFFERAGRLNERIVAIHDEQDRNDAARPAARPPLPDPDCGE
jgi:hypothetical protein